MPATAIDEGVSLALAEHRAATLSDLRYRYHLRIPRERDAPVTGTVEVRFAWSDPRGRDLVLDFKDPARRVTAVRVDRAAVDWTPRYDHVVVPASALRPNARNRVELDFEAGDEALNRSGDFLYTLFVPDRAHFSLPLFDQPNLKARFTLTLETPGGWTAAANGETVEAPDPAGGGRGSWRFAETQPIPTYLFAFTSGNAGWTILAARKFANTSLVHTSSNQSIVTRLPNHMCAVSWATRAARPRYAAWVADSSSRRLDAR